MAVSSWPDNDIDSPVDYPVTFDEPVTFNGDITINGGITFTDVLATVASENIYATTKLGVGAYPFSTLNFEVDSSGNTDVAGTLDVTGIASFASSILAAANTGGTGGETAPGLSFYTDDSWTPTLTLASSTTAISGYDFQKTMYGRFFNCAIYTFQLKITYAADITTAEKQTYQISLPPIPTDFTNVTQAIGLVSFESNSTAMKVGSSWQGAIRSSTADELSLRMMADTCTAGDYIVIHAIGFYVVLD